MVDINSGCTESFTAYLLLLYKKTSVLLNCVSCLGCLTLAELQQRQKKFFHQATSLYQGEQAKQLTINLSNYCQEEIIKLLQLEKMSRKNEE